jgi:GPH family glycoside/pentoside/hexuronide:cation symporter
MAKKQNLTLTEKLGYGLGDTASNIVYQAVINVLLYFYTDVYGITAAAAGTLMLVVRLFDAVTDPMMGAVADRTKTKHGRYRPWMLWVAIPYGILAVAAFITPDVAMGTKLVYAYISYALLMTAYTAVNVPYSALGGVMTGDSEERANLQTWRFAMAMVGGFLVTTSIFPLAEILGGGDDPASMQLGVPLAMIIMAIIGVLCFFGCFALTKEYVKPDPQEPKRNVFEDLGAMFSNSQWVIIAVATLIIMTRGAMQSAAKPYFVDYYLINSLTGWFGETNNLLGLFLGLTMLAGVGGAISANRLIRSFCKVRVMKYALAGTVAMNLMLFLVPREWMFQALLLTMFSNFFHMMFVPILFSTIPDTVDFGKRTMGMGAMAMFCAGHLFVLKMGNAMGGFFTGFVLAGFGYQANVEQTETALRGILIAFAGSSVVAALLVIFTLQFYRLTRGWQDRVPDALPDARLGAQPEDAAVGSLSEADRARP